MVENKFFNGLWRNFSHTIINWAKFQICKNLLTSEPGSHNNHNNNKHIKFEAFGGPFVT